MDFAVFDAHCDTLTKLLDTGGGLAKNGYMVDLERMSRYKNGYCQVFAAFVDKNSINVSPYERVVSLMEKYRFELEKNSSFVSHCTNAEKMEECFGQKKIAAFLSIEGGEALEGSLETLRAFYEMGVRIITLTWNYDNELCGGIGGEEKGGLTKFGAEVIKEMNRVGMLIDVSHISEKGFWEVIEQSEKPIAATHSNAFAITNHPRNLKDDQIKAIIKNGGCIGINLYRNFLASGKGDVSDIIRHIEHIFMLGGKDCVGLGSDFDGIDSSPNGICGVEDIYKIAESLLKSGYSEECVRNVMSGNFRRVLAETVF